MRRFYGNPGHWHDRILQARSGIDCAAGYDDRDTAKLGRAIVRLLLAAAFVTFVWALLIFAFAV